MSSIAKPVAYLSRADVPAGARVLDIFESATRELFFIENPQIRKDDPSAGELIQAFARDQHLSEVWMYYPWLTLAVHMPGEDMYFRLRTARNRNLITEDEQRAYRSASVGIAGLSVGSAAAAMLVMTGGPKTLKLADADIVETTNLNRIRAKLPDIGTNKVDIAAREAWELDPFMDIHLWREGVSRDNLSTFITGEPKLDVFIDEMDDIEMKIAARLMCRELRIPVLMATDNGDGAILDVERYDEEPGLEIFHGRLGSPIPEGKIEKKDSIRMAITVIDPAYFTERQQDSILAIGRTLGGVAQLGTAASVAGAAIAFAVRRIMTKQPLPSGRYVMSPEEQIIPKYNEDAERERRWTRTQEFADTFGIIPKRRN